MVGGGHAVDVLQRQCRRGNGIQPIDRSEALELVCQSSARGRVGGGAQFAKMTVEAAADAANHVARVRGPKILDNFIKPLAAERHLELLLSPTPRPEG